MKIQDFEIGQKTFIVAEIAGNHNGNLETAMELINFAKQSGADAVKFQTYKAEKYIDESVQPMPHVRGTYKTQQERFRSLQFSSSQWKAIVKHCQSLNIIFFSTPADKDSVDFLDPYVPVYKIQSGDVTNIPLIRYIVEKDKPIIMSTGMASETELETAVKEIPEGRLILLHCVSIYPTPPDKANLLSIPQLKEKFNVPVGYSDHTMSSMACLAAVALGAVVVERHFTNDKNQPIGDHKFSANPEEFRQMTDGIREIEKMKGGFEARLTESELNMRYAMRRGLVLIRDVSRGTTITSDMLISLRPEKGISALKYDYVLGKKAAKDLKKGNFLEEGDFSSQ